MPKQEVGFKVTCRSIKPHSPVLKAKPLVALELNDVYFYRTRDDTSKTFFKGYEIVSFKTAVGDARLAETASLHRNSAEQA